MTDRSQEIQVHHIHHPKHGIESFKSRIPEKGPSTSQVIAVITLFPIGGILLTIAGIILTITVISLALATPLFVIFSPVLVPATIVIGLALMGFLASGAFGLTAVSSLSWIFNYLRGSVTGATADMPEQLEYAKRHMREAASHVGQKTKDVGQAIQNKAQEGGRTHESGRTR
ncbi:oleosin H2-like [Telopea speciosissima]|uniref:oleosin H2-like n=1 Tax=Telopea speciosissima TaxID=54955 RepID=UPI001CC6B40F|nr:oleosin H2-like [Telopea speciosissima]